MLLHSRSFPDVEMKNIQDLKDEPSSAAVLGRRQMITLAFCDIALFLGRIRKEPRLGGGGTHCMGSTEDRGEREGGRGQVGL